MIRRTKQVLTICVYWNETRIMASDRPTDKDLQEKALQLYHLRLGNEDVENIKKMFPKARIVIE